MSKDMVRIDTSQQVSIDVGEFIRGKGYWLADWRDVFIPGELEFSDEWAILTPIPVRMFLGFSVFKEYPEKVGEITDLKKSEWTLHVYGENNLLKMKTLAVQLAGAFKRPINVSLETRLPRYGYAKESHRPDLF